MSPAPPAPPASEVRVWYADTAEIWREAGRVRHALAWLAPHERDRYARYHRELDRDMFLLGRVMARTLVGRALGCAPTAWRWEDGARGRPEVGAGDAGVSRWSFNLAHSGGLVVCALAADGPVGVDVEDRRRRPVDPQVVRRFCAPPEVQDIERHGLDGWHDRFLQYWTLKEAYLKARGLGIAVPLSDISFSLDAGEPRVSFLNTLEGTAGAWTFFLQPLAPHHYLAVGAEAAAGARTFRVEPFAPELVHGHAGG
jgi:4'-phosphopantetheinyl transferase